ncbi:MAG: glycosyltransferase, partial [Nitrososphaera sp.]|nr:glycosyltransferase [Nitrososphaera sp.]
MMLRICHLISGDLWAGAEVMAFHLLNGLKALPGVELFVILLNPGRLSEELEGRGIPIYVINESKCSFAEIAWIATKIVRKRAPRILHSHRYKENILSYLISNTLAKDTVLVSTQHGMPEFYGGCRSAAHRLKSALHYRLLASKFDRMVAVSLDVKESLVRDYGFQEKHIQVIHNGSFVPETASRDFRTREHFTIGSAGRFFPVKDYPFMVEVAREVIAKNDKIRFELAGEGPLLGDIQAPIKRYGLEEHFVLRGLLYDVGTFYQGLDIYLNTSMHEGIPMSVLEAMAYGLPAIVPKVGGLREIVTDGVDGYLV